MIHYRMIEDNRGAETPVKERSIMPSIALEYLINIDTDVVLFKSLLAVILLTALWPLGFLGYLVTVYGAHILVW
jgi:hypothetical protein